MRVMGIDPGIYGAVVVCCDDSWQFHELPRMEVSKGRYELDLSQFVALMKNLSYNPTLGSDQSTMFSMTVIEKPPIVPGNGVLAYKSLFMNYGQILGVLATLGVPSERPDPKQWKKVVLAGTKMDKEAAITYVKNRYPDIKIPPHPKPKRKNDLHDGVADAVCLAEYGRRLLVGA